MPGTALGTVTFWWMCASPSAASGTGPATNAATVFESGAQKNDAVIVVTVPSSRCS